MELDTMRMRISMMVGAALLVFAAAAVVTGAQEGGNPEAAELENPVEATPESIETGERLYMRRCRGCHGRDAAGGPPKEAGETPTSNLIDDEYDHGSTDGEIFYVIMNGVPPELVMSPFDDRFDDTETWHVVNYLRSLQQTQ
jgi:mono/diheme cytochrome c family protein